MFVKVNINSSRRLPYVNQIFINILIYKIIGCVWPLEGMPKVLRWMSYTTPTTLPALSLRGTIYKGKSISDSEVYLGFLVNLGWIITYLFVTVWGVKRKASL